MNKTDEKLLIKDLCARVPYGVMCARLPLYGNGVLGSPRKLIGIHPSRRYMLEFDNGEYMPNEYMLDDIKPYLRSISSMTKEEAYELRGWEDYELISWLDCEEICFCDLTVKYETLVKLMDWLYEHHFDIHGLIEKGLALEAPEGIYNF